MSTAATVGARTSSVLALAVACLLAATPANAGWGVSGEAAGPEVAVTASQTTPVVTVPSCTWNSTTRVLNATVSWSKSDYASSTVTRQVLNGSTTTVATALDPSITTIQNAIPISIGTQAGRTATTSVYTFRVQAHAGLYWTRTGAAIPHSFTATNRSGSTPDKCVVT